MARERTNLSERELKCFENNGRQGDISSVSRRIGFRLKHREERWTTLGQMDSTPTAEYHYQQGTRMPKPHTEFKTHREVAPPRSSSTTGMTTGMNTPWNQGMTPDMDHGMVPTQPKIVLLGPDGGGKSALGNLLVGDEVFRVAATSGSGLQRCETRFMMEEQEQWEVVDTPGEPFTPTSKRWFNNSTGNSRDSLNEIKEHINQADVIIFVLNTSHKRTPDMGMKAFTQILPDNLADTGMLVTTHGDTHYSTKGTTELLADIKESPEICNFLRKISNRVVIVELGDGQPSEDAILDGTAFFSKERDQARDMVMAMARHIMQKPHARGKSPFRP